MTEYQSPYFPEPCTDPTHEYGCPGRAGGDHQPKMTPIPLTDDIRLEIGELVFDKFFSGSPENGNREEMVAWLEALGFDRVEVIQGDLDDILLMLLWRFGRDQHGEIQLLDEFIIEFSGHDAANIALFNLVKEVSL